MSTYLGYAELTARIQADIILVLDKWKIHFGHHLDAMWADAHAGTHHHTIPPGSEAIEDLVSTAKEHLNGRGRSGEASLFVRDPREDRLILLCSTSTNIQRGTADTKQVRDPEAHYDPTLRRYYYTLYDRLADTMERESERARFERGLTGWVAVAGHYLIVNGEYGKHGLVSLAEDRPETLAACQAYGRPIWGRHISEAPTDPQKPKRYIAVPVKSSTDSSKTIGVLRYACPCAGKELDEGDLYFLSELAQLISATLGLDAVTIGVFRGSHLPHEADHLRRTYDFGAFLRFIAISLRSNIASLYIDIGSIRRTESTLRLVDAYGIRGSVGTLRDEIKDYPASNTGFTRWLFDEISPGPIVESSVHQHRSWQGKNTRLFYGDLFRKFREPGSGDPGKPTDVARKYEIKIIGIPVSYRGDKIGVLKVELPNSFDDSQHYGSADQSFLKECADALAPVLEDFHLFLQGEWFDKPDPVRTIVNVTRMAAEVLRTRLLSPTEARAFWSSLEAFSEKNKNGVMDELRETISRFPQEHRKEVQEAAEWLLGLGKSVLAEHIAELMSGG